MGQLRLEVGTLSAERNFADAAGSTVLNNFIASYDGPTDGTNQEKLDWCIDQLVRYVVGQHKAHVRNVAAQEAGETAFDEAEEL